MVRKGRRKPVIGLAGGVGAGKSTVARILADLGCVVTDSDALAREALADPSIAAEIRRWWGDDVFDASGRVDRRAVAAIVFNDPKERRRLEELTHPWIESRRKTLWAEAERSRSDVRAFVIDAPLVFEAGLDRVCDAVIFVDAPRQTRIARVERERGWDASDLARREAAQMPLDEKRRRADHVVMNGGDPSALAAEVGRVLDRILAAGGE